MAPVGDLAWWPERGYRANPYDTSPLEREEETAELLVGREGFLQEIIDHLQASTTHLPIGAPPGSGKTSLVHCVHGALARSAEEFQAGQLLLPVSTLVSPRMGEEPASFVERAMLELGGALLSYAPVIAAAGGDTGRRVEALGRLARDPLIASIAAGVNVSTIGMTAGRTAEGNASFAFRTGLASLVRSALTGAFPVDESGALVACIDDLETLGGPREVSEFVAAVREPLLDMHGVKWVLLGADDVLDGLPDHWRLGGIVSRPKRLSQLPPDEISNVVERRIELYRVGSTVTVPVNGEAFERLYEASAQHLRTALGLCQAFTLFANRRGMLDGDEVLYSECEDEEGHWIREDVPIAVVEDFLEHSKLVEWHRIVEMGGPAAAVLLEVSAAEAIDHDVLTRGEPAREAAVDELRSRSFLLEAAGDLDRPRPLRLSSSGFLAVQGSVLAG